MTAAFDYQSLVTKTDGGLKRLDAAIEGMTCAACIGDIERGLRDLPGLVSARVNYTNRRLALEWRDENFDLTPAFARLRCMGYELHPFELADSERAETEPKVFTKIHMHFTITGKGVPAAAVERAIALSHDKYCSASIMLGKTAEITASFEVVPG